MSRRWRLFARGYLPWQSRVFFAEAVENVVTRTRYHPRLGAEVFVGKVISRGLFVVAVAIGVSGCAQSPITSMRIERAIAPTFANLVHTQMLWIGLPPIAASDFA